MKPLIIVLVATLIFACLWSLMDHMAKKKTKRELDKMAKDHAAAMERYKEAKRKRLDDL